MKTTRRLENTTHTQTYVIAEEVVFTMVNLSQGLPRLLLWLLLYKKMAVIDKLLSCRVEAALYHTSGSILLICALIGIMPFLSTERWKEQ